MATIGLNFGSATSGAGFDVTQTVTSLLAIESAVEVPLKAQLASLQAQDAAFSGLGANLSSLSKTVASLTNFDGLFSLKQGSSSNNNVLALTNASSTAVAGSHTVTVSSLAATSSTYSDSVSNASDTLSGSLSIQIGSSAAQTISLGSGSNTLLSLAQTINNGAYGVRASLVTDSGGTRLSLVSNSSGAAGQITLGGTITDSTTNATVAFHTGQTGADAQVNVDGLPVTSASNTLTGAIPGVTFELLSSAPNVPVQIQIKNDNTSIEAGVLAFVAAYNTSVASVKTQEGLDATGKAQPLFGDPTLALIQNQLSSSLLNGGSSGSISSFTQIGLNLNPDGTLTLDQTKLDNTLNTSFSDVLGFFQNAGSFGQQFATSLDGIGSVSTTGAIYLALGQNTLQESGINANISGEDTRVAADKIRLTKELNTANQILQSIPDQLNQVDEIYNAITGYTGKR